MKIYIDKKCRLCRREGNKLFLKGERCQTPKCPVERKGAVPPGAKERGRRPRFSEYGFQLREKQKMKRIYGLQEKQFNEYFQKARKTGESTGEVLIQLLESRLDNVLYRSGLAPSRRQAKQLISHGQININNKKITIPSYQVKPDQVISLSTVGIKIPAVTESLSKKDVVLPGWLERKAAVAKMKRLPNREEIEANINEQAVVEYYSR